MLLCFPPKVLKIGAEELSKPLTTLFNSCIRIRVWPSDWKRRNWTAVYKKKTTSSQRRSININQFPSSHVWIKSRRNWWNCKKNACFGSRIYKNSNAYRKRHSCETTLVNLIESSRKARDVSLSTFSPQTWQKPLMEPKPIVEFHTI